MKRVILFLFLPFQLPAQQTIPQQLDTLLVTSGFNGSVLIARHGKVLLEKGYGWKNYAEGARNDSATIYPIASITKQFTAALVLRLQEEGKLNVKDPLTKYFPNYPGGAGITLHHLLTHTSGIPDYMKGAVVNDPARVADPVPDSLIQRAFRGKLLRFAPGTRREYSNSGYYLLKLIIEKVTGKTYYTVFRECILQPLGIQPAGFDFVHLQSRDKAQGYVATGKDDGEPVNTFDSTLSNAAGALYTSVRGLYTWDRAIARGLAGQGNAVLQRASWEQALRPYLQYAGYGWIVDTLYGHAFQRHGGNMPGFSTDLLRLPVEDVTLILLENRQSQDHAELMVKLLGIVLGRETKNAPQVVLTEAQLDRFTGSYTGNWDLQVKPANGGLLITVAGQSIRVTPAGDTVFYSTDFFGKFIFREGGLEVNRLGHVFDFRKTAAP